ncbi:MAG: amidohydrolase family protein [Phycisphaeraceae bacterium]|nr:amidohydrolase family protein [Phycisphaeraceae bacterium]
MQITPHTQPLNNANRLGLNYRHQATQLPWQAPLIDAHTHLWGVEAARHYFQIASWFGIQSTWSQTPLKDVPAIALEFGDRVNFVAVPDYYNFKDPNRFTTSWFENIEQFAALGTRMCKFWSAPRGRDVHPSLTLDSPERQYAMKLAYQANMMFMVHIADPDTWFTHQYKDHRKYGNKADQYLVLERLLDQYGDVTWLAAHMAGHPEDLNHLQQLLDRHPNLYLDTSACKWMIRELSKHGSRLTDFIHQNAGRIMWGTDIVAQAGAMGLGDDLYASRFWAMRSLFETNYHGPSPIVDPDLSRLNPSLPRKSTATVHGINLDPATLQGLYHDTALTVLGN